MDEHGADALRFGLLAMSSTQDVRFSEARVQQGRDLANKMWNASRLVLMEAGTGSSRARARIASRTAGSPRGCSARSRSVTRSIEAYDFSHAALDLYEFFWSELCDWYLEIVKPRLYDGDEDASATLLWALEQVLALAHPMMPFVTEEIYSYLPSRPAEALVDPSRSPRPMTALIDEGPRGDRPGDRAHPRACGAGAIWPGCRSSRCWRPGADESGRTSWSRGSPGSSSPRTGGEPIASVGGVELLETEGVDPDAVRGRIEERRDKLRAEVKRGEGKLSNEGFVAKAPADVVDAEREKLAAYRAELEELGG